MKNQHPVTHSNATGPYRISGGQPGRKTLAGAVTTGGTLLPSVRGEATTTGRTPVSCRMPASTGIRTRAMATRPTPGLCRLPAAHHSTAARTCATTTTATRRTTAAACGRESSVGWARSTPARAARLSMATRLMPIARGLGVNLANSMSGRRYDR